MEQTATLICPKCNVVQIKEIYDLTLDTGDMAGTFSHDCENCEHEFTVEYEYKPFVKTY